jgi:hypothetical protein
MKKINILSIVAFGFVSGLNAQAFFEFNNRHLSQSQLWNPGFMPQYKATLSVGQTYFGAQFVGATLNGLFGKEETPLQTVNRMVGENEKQLGIDLFHQSDLFHFGFRSKKSYFAINSTLINEASVRMRDRFMSQEVWSRMGVNPRDVVPFVLNDPTREVFQQMLFAKIVPNCKKLGLLDRNDSWLRRRFEEMGVIQFENAVDTGEEYVKFELGETLEDVQH